MTFNLLDLVSDSKMATKRENKKKLHALLDKYGSVEEIERSGDLRDSFELDFARIDGALDEVLEERRMGYREPQSSSDDEIKTNVKKSNSLLPDDEDFSLEGLTLSDRQRKAIDKLDMNTQLTVIRALREQQGVEKPKPKRENSEASKSELDVLRQKVDKANREIKIADNEHSGTKSDVRVESKDEEEKELNSVSLEKKYSKLLSNVREHLENKNGEDFVENVYLDTNGKISTGIGLNINDFDTFMKIDFEVNGKTATYKEKLKAYNDFMELKKIKEYGKKYDAEHFKKYSDLRINRKTAKNIMYQHTLNDLKKLREGIENFDKLPLPMQEVLMDIRYNTGNVSKLNWPKLREGIRTKNLSLIADNVSRKDVSAERNKWARDKILSIKEKW